MTISMEVGADPTTAADGATLTERVQPFLDEIASRAQETEDARRVSAANIDLVRAAGFVRAFVPKKYGGDERDLWDYLEGVRALTKACPSTGWVTGVSNVHQVSVAMFTQSIQDQVWADGPDTWIVSSGTPAMVARLTDGGVILSGRGRWSSGCDHAEWALVGMKVPDASDERYVGHTLRPFMFLAHKSEYTIDDTWQSRAMAGSGSNDLVFDNLFVSTDRLEGLDALTFGYSKGAGTVDNWLAALPMPASFASFLPAIALGCADGMIEEFVKRQRIRKNAYSGAAGIVNASGHMRLAESMHEIESLTVYFKHIIDQMREFGERRERLTEAAFHEMIQRLPFITERAVQVVERLFVGAGSSAMAIGNPMQRYWRDAHAARMHTGSDYDTCMQWYGRSVLGLMPTPDL
jgi:4-hydroxyphenylacetate 3-monooxygenase